MDDEEAYSDVEHDYAKRLFEVYGDHCGWKAWDGSPMRTWEQLLNMKSAVCTHWYAVARYVLNDVS
jgi:hypothetical protein